MTPPQFPKIVRLVSGDWAREAAERIHAAVRSSAERNGGVCNLLLTGGRAAARVYAAWAPLISMGSAIRMSVFWSDERCVAADHAESNYGMTRSHLFPARIPDGWQLHRMVGDASNLEAEAHRYGALLPTRFDVAVLGVGEDGHVASLFPGAPSLLERRRRIIRVTSPKPPSCRLTITPTVLGDVDVIFVLAPGKAKARVLDRVLADPSDSVPAKLVLRGTWLLDHDS